MRALVVYESIFGNTREVAEAMASELEDYGVVVCIEVGQAPTRTHEFDLVVIGGPVHAWGMSRPASREDARKLARSQGQDPVSKGIGVREWLQALEHAEGSRAAAAFDTAVHTPSWLPTGSAARPEAKRLVVNLLFLISAGSLVLGLATLVFYLVTHNLILSPVRSLKDTAERVPSTSNETAFFLPAETCEMATTPRAPSSKRMRMPAASSLDISSATSSSSASAAAKVSTGPTGWRRIGTNVWSSAMTASMRLPDTNDTRSNQWEPMSATARSAPASSGTRRQFQSVSSNSQSWR